MKKARGLPIVGKICTNPRSEKLFREHVIKQMVRHSLRRFPRFSKKEIDTAVLRAKKLRQAILKRSNEGFGIMIDLPLYPSVDQKELLKLRKKFKTKISKCKGTVKKKCANCDYDHLTVWTRFKKKYKLCPQCGATRKHLDGIPMEVKP